MKNGKILVYLAAFAPFIATILSSKLLPEQYFRVNKEGVEYSYDVDTWHWWMLEYLNKIVKSSSV
jgi:hypothetical protein